MVLPTKRAVQTVVMMGRSIPSWPVPSSIMTERDTWARVIPARYLREREAK
jgi:hypothetical protein